MILLFLTMFACGPLSLPEHERDHADGVNPSAAGEGHDHDHADGVNPSATGEGHDHDHEGHDHDHAGHDHGRVETVHLAQGVAESLSLVTVHLDTVDWAPSQRIPGTVRVDPDLQAEVTTPSAVRVASLPVPPHATVRAGELLAVVELVDPEVRQLQVQAVQARAELLQARTERDRLRTYLASIGASAAEERSRVSAELDVQEARVQSADSTLHAVLAALELAGLSPSQVSGLEEQGTVVNRVEIRAPRLPGAPELEVASRPVRLGQTVPAGDPLFELVALERLLIVGEAFEADLVGVRRAAREGLSVTVYFPDGLRAHEGLEVLSVEGALDDERERITHFFVPLPNEAVHTKVVDGARYVDWEHRAGSRVELSVATAAPGPRFVLPSSALVPEAGLTWVYRKAGSTWERVAVTPESTEGREVVLPLGCGLHEDDEVVVGGALQLDLVRRQAGAGAVDPHAGHNH